MLVINRVIWGVWGTSVEGSTVGSVVGGVEGKTVNTGGLLLKAPDRERITAINTQTAATEDRIMMSLFLLICLTGEDE